MSKEVVKKETGSIVVPDAFKKKGVSTSVIDQKDMLIPRLLIMQGLSKYVSEERAQMGDIVNSVSCEVLGGKGKWVKFVPLMTFKTVEYYDMSTGKPKRDRVENWSVTKHTNTEWEQTINGKPYRVVECLNFYLFLEKDLENPAGMPYLACYRSTQKQAGKKLITHFMQMELMGAEPWFGMLEMTTAKQQNDQGVFYTPDFKPVGQTDAKYAEKIQKWVDLISKNQVKVDEEADEVVPTTTAKGAKTTSSAAEAQF